MYFLRLWVSATLAALLAMLIVLAVWLVIHVGFGDELASLMLNYITNFRLILLACMASALVGLIEIAVVISWQRRKPKRS